MRKWVLITLLAVGAISLFFASSDAFAFGRRCGIFRGRCAPVSCGTVCAPVCNTVCTTVCAPVVETICTPTFAYPVLVPAFQFQYVPTTYAVPTVPVTGYPQAYPVVQQGAYPAAVQPYGYGMQTQPYGYQQPNAYNMQQQQQQQQQLGLSRKDQIRELAKALLEEMNKMADGTSDGGPPPVPGTPQPQQSQAPRQPDQQLTQVVFNAFGRTCAQCHTGVGAKKEFQIYTQIGHLNQNVNWLKVKEEVARGHMPPKETQFQLSVYERQSILEWLRQIGVN